MYLADIYSADTWGDEDELYAYLPDQGRIAGGTPRALQTHIPMRAGANAPKALMSNLPFRAGANMPKAVTIHIPRRGT